MEHLAVDLGKLLIQGEEILNQMKYGGVLMVDFALSQILETFQPDRSHLSLRRPETETGVGQLWLIHGAQMTEGITSSTLYSGGDDVTSHSDGEGWVVVAAFDVNGTTHPTVSSWRNSVSL
jgi:hypothetical protein